MVRRRNAQIICKTYAKDKSLLLAASFRIGAVNERRRTSVSEEELDRAGSCNLSVMSPPNNGRFSQHKDFASCTERPWYGVSMISNKAKKSHISISI